MKPAAAYGRPLRADARRNRACVLEAARAVFRREGLSAQMDSIAAEAGLGVGTLYRHFPTREALIDVLIQERLDHLASSAAAAARKDDPWMALQDLVWQLAAVEAEDRGMADILADYHARSIDTPAVSTAALIEHLGTVVIRAQRAGAMRCDVSALDVLTIVCGIGKMMRPGNDDDPERWRRLVSVILDGLHVPVAYTGESVV